jgi:hypothetical protein
MSCQGFAEGGKMSTIARDYSKGTIVDSQLGKRTTDSRGEPISGVRMDVSRAYAGIPRLLQKAINEIDTSARTDITGAYGGATSLFWRKRYTSETENTFWEEITQKIDYICSNLDHTLAELDKETGFSSNVVAQVKAGKKLLIKPNLVSPMVIDPATHGEGSGASICTEWPLIAALMRWFHDKLGINYHQMALGEASAITFMFSAMFSKGARRTITTEAVFEGRSGSFYGGWGFYFVRKYLSECHPATHKDDPLRGYEDSLAGRFIPPGRSMDRLMVYDLNKASLDRARTVTVPEGANFHEITLHKVIVGGNPDDADDLKDYPGCVLINVPKLKIHAQDLITNAIKNLGIGLYPTQCASGKGKRATSWKYSCPPTPNPTLKGKLPHSPWVLEMDENTGLPVQNKSGKYIAIKTAGFPGTQSDIIRAVQSQNVFMVHVVDAIDMINISHNPDGLAVRVPEGFVWSSLDCVALDLFCARYCFKTVPMHEALKLKEENGWSTEFVHHVPVARLDGKNIVTEVGFDSPLFRYNLYKYAEKRGVGKQEYYVVGWDSLTQTPLASLAGHLGRIDDSRFIDMTTKTMYYNPTTILHDLQKTVLSYAKAHDELTGSSLFKDFMDSFDENNDGVIDYDEMGRKGFQTALISLMCHANDLMLSSEYGLLKGSFMQLASTGKYGNKNWNPQGHDFLSDLHLMILARVAFEMSQYKEVIPDSFVPGMAWGKGMWPSWHTVLYVVLTSAIYGSQSPSHITLGYLYGLAFQYADKVLNNGGYTGSIDGQMSDPDSVDKYIEAVSKGVDPLDFTLYVPPGYGSLEKVKIPNVEETDDAKKVWTAHFKGGQEVW